MCRANLMAAGAHDTGIGIKHLFPRQFIQRRSPGTGTVCRLHQFSLRFSVGESQIQWSQKNVDVLTSGKVRKKKHDQTHRKPPGHMNSSFNTIPTEEKRSHQARGGHRPFGGFPLRQMKCGPQPSCPDMKDDKNADDQGISADSSRLYFCLKLDVAVEFKNLGFANKSTNQKIDDPHQDKDAEKIRKKIESQGHRI